MLSSIGGKRATLLLQLPSIGKLERPHSRLMEAMPPLVRSLHLAAVHSQGLEHQVQFIDFEYSCVSFRGFDWGNHFNEYAGFECEYTRYPDRAQAATFLAAYLAGDCGSIPVRLCLSLCKIFLPFVNTQQCIVAAVLA